MRIHILGPSGSGVTTIGKHLSRIAGQYIHIDVDDLVWKKTLIPFTTKYSSEETASRLRTLLLEHENIVVTGIIYPWGDSLKEHFDLVILVTAEDSVRYQRLIQREYEQYGARMLQGGDMHAQFLRFLDWAMSYTKNTNPHVGEANTINWLHSLSCPVKCFNNTTASSDEIETFIHSLL